MKSINKFFGGLKKHLHCAANNKKGFTLVEMIVTFGLLTIFMASIAATLAPVMKQYTKIEKLNHIQNIQDGVLEACRSYIQQASNEMDSDGNVNGYVKLREVSSGIASTVPVNNVLYVNPRKGSAIEFKSNNLYTVLDTRGYHGFKCKASGDLESNPITDYYNYSSGYLSVRYYAPFKNDRYKDIITASTASFPAAGSADDDLTEYANDVTSEDGTGYYVCYGAYQCFDEDFYMGYKTKVYFSIPRQAMFEKTVNGTTQIYVNYVVATVRVSDSDLSSANEYYEDSMPIYFKNPLPYENDKTSLRYDG